MLINAQATTCQGDSCTGFYFQGFSKSSKKFDLNSRGGELLQAGVKQGGKQGLAPHHSTAI
jgi:hypothetical protein